MANGVINAIAVVVAVDFYGKFANVAEDVVLVLVDKTVNMCVV